MRRVILFLSAVLCLTSQAFAAETVKETDKNGDGKTDMREWMNGSLNVKTEEDTDLDGKVDVWRKYDAKGTLIFEMYDSDKNGTPNEFTTLLSGRLTVMKESDQNEDGRVDRRMVCEWGSRRLPDRTEMPGYIPLWREEDKDFDGIIDDYMDRSDPTNSKTRIGKKIDTQTAEQKAASDPGPGSTKGPGERRMDDLNEKYGLNKPPKE